MGLGGVHAGSGPEEFHIEEAKAKIQVQDGFIKMTHPDGSEKIFRARIGGKVVSDEKSLSHIVERLKMQFGEMEVVTAVHSRVNNDRKVTVLVSSEKLIVSHGQGQLVERHEILAKSVNEVSQRVLQGPMLPVTTQEEEEVTTLKTPLAITEGETREDVVFKPRPLPEFRIPTPNLATVQPGFAGRIAAPVTKSLWAALDAKELAYKETLARVNEELAGQSKTGGFSPEQHFLRRFTSQNTHAFGANALFRKYEDEDKTKTQFDEMVKQTVVFLLEKDSSIKSDTEKRAIEKTGDRLQEISDLRQRVADLNLQRLYSKTESADNRIKEDYTPDNLKDAERTELTAVRDGLLQVAKDQKDKIDPDMNKGPIAQSLSVVLDVNTKRLLKEIEFLLGNITRQEYGL